jgi:DNA-directed RNA polymerase subunit RPC12/RpoP
MSIPITCTVCRKSMKIGDGITEAKKIRCTGCGTVILLTPDPSSPGDVKVSYPRKTAKPNTMTEKQKQILLWCGLGALGLVLAIGLWYSLSGPSTHGAVEGEVTLDNAPLEKGTITFMPLEGTKGVAAKGPIVRGRYSTRASLGTNKVEIRGGEENTLYKLKADLTIEIKAGSNTGNFEVASK